MVLKQNLNFQLNTWNYFFFNWIWSINYINNVNILNFYWFFCTIKFFFSHHNITRGVSWYSIYHICWYTICGIYNFITHNYWIINNNILTNTFARIPTIIFLVRTIRFTLALRFISIPFLIWIAAMNSFQHQIFFSFFSPRFF